MQGLEDERTRQASLEQPIHHLGHLHDDHVLEQIVRVHHASRVGRCGRRQLRRSTCDPDVQALRRGELDLDGGVLQCLLGHYRCGLRRGELELLGCVGVVALQRAAGLVEEVADSCSHSVKEPYGILVLLLLQVVPVNGGVGRGHLPEELLAEFVLELGPVAENLGRQYLEWLSSY